MLQEFLQSEQIMKTHICSVAENQSFIYLFIVYDQMYADAGAFLVFRTKQTVDFQGLCVGFSAYKASQPSLD